MHRFLAILTGAILFAVAIGSAQQPSSGGPVLSHPSAEPSIRSTPPTSAACAPRARLSPTQSVSRGVCSTLKSTATARVGRRPWVMWLKALGA